MGDAIHGEVLVREGKAAVKAGENTVKVAKSVVEIKGKDAVLELEREAKGRRREDNEKWKEGRKAETMDS